MENVAFGPAYRSNCDGHCDGLPAHAIDRRGQGCQYDQDACYRKDTVDGILTGDQNIHRAGLSRPGGDSRKTGLRHNIRF